MGKQIWYSKPLKYFWHVLYGTQKRLTPELTEVQIFQVLRNNLLKVPFAMGETSEERELLISGLHLWKDDCIGNFLHIFFLDKILRDFLETTRLSDLDGIRSYLYDNGEKKGILYVKTKEKTDCVYYTFGLHIPFESDGYAFSLSLLKNNSIELYFSHGGNGGRISDEYYSDLNKKLDERSLTLCKMFRLAINTLAYMKCFPECVTDGVPRISHENHKERSTNCVTFQVSEKIIESENTSRAVIPHFRKGHFRLLQSDYFTTKKGQLVFITETMVKGKAKTVSTATDIEKFGGGAENENVS